MAAMTYYNKHCQEIQTCNKMLLLINERLVNDGLNQTLRRYICVNIVYLYYIQYT